MNTSIQRWIYVNGHTVPETLRKLADAIERTEAQGAPEADWWDDTPNVVTLDYDDDGEISAGISVSYHILNSEIVK